MADELVEKDLENLYRRLAAAEADLNFLKLQNEQIRALMKAYNHKVEEAFNQFAAYNTNMTAILKWFDFIKNHPAKPH